MADPVAAIVESATAQAAVRAAYSSLREAESQLAKHEQRAEKARGAVQARRLDLGKALLEARKAWPQSGPRAKGWGEFLEREGITQPTAWRHMREADPTYTDRSSDAETQPDAPESFHSSDPSLNETSANSPESGLAKAGQTRTSPRAMQLMPGFDLRLGRWQEALYQVGVVDTLVCDPPFGAATHEGSSRATRDDGSPVDGLSPDYDAWTADDVTEFIHAWSPRVRGWMACITSHDLIGAYQRAYESVDRLAFAPVPIILRGMSHRLVSDGPSSWAVYLMVARPRTQEFMRWGSLPGAYVGGPSGEASKGRGKPEWLLDEIVRDYSRQHDLVCDPLAGWGSTLFAALRLDRRCIGAEVDRAAHEVATSKARIPIA